MPRVHTYSTRARKGDKPNLRCGACGKDIEPGQKRYEWEFRYGGRRVQHVTCGYPKRSQLTTSKMADIYGTIENIQKDGWGLTADEVELNLQSILESAEQVKSEYEEAAQNFGGQGPSQEKADELDQFIDTLNDAIREVTSEFAEDGEDHDDYVSRIHEIAETACNECP